MQNISTTLKVSSSAVAKPLSATMKLALMWTFLTGKEDPELPLLQGISSLELTASEISSQIHAINRHISISTVQRRLRESGLHGQIAAKKPPLKDTNSNKRPAMAKKHEQWTLDLWNSVFWSDESKCAIFGGFHCEAWRRRRCYSVGVFCW